MMAWDLDNTLIHTREANLRAYMSLGVTPPQNFHRIHWSEWTTTAAHEEKGRIIGKFLSQFAEITPMFSIYTQVGGPILTATSDQVLQFIRSAWPIFTAAHIIRCATPDQKVAALQSISPGVYVDDDQYTIDLVRKQTAWKAALVTF